MTDLFWRWSCHRQTGQNSNWTRTTLGVQSERRGEAWQSEKLSDEGVTITGMEGGALRGLGWDLITDKETPFALDLKTGTPIPFACS
jgi:hypothetical protein